MIEIISAFIANALTKFIKPPKELTFTEEDIAARKTLVRAVNLVVGAVLTVMGAWAVGEPLDASTIEASVTSLFDILQTFAFSQAIFHLAKK